MTVYRKDLMAEVVRSLVEYAPATGVFTWLARPGSTTAIKSWNGKHAGKEAGVIDRRGYRRVKLYGRYYAGHRLAWLIVTGEWPVADIDHINKNPSDNRLCNLREATRSQNCANVSAKSHNKSGLKGATFNKASKKWRAQIRKDGTNYCLGSYSTAEEAHLVYVEAAKRMHGEFARAC